MTPPQKTGLHAPAPDAPKANQGNVKSSGNAARPQTAEERRRAQRVILKMPVVVHISGKANPIHGFTHTVSATGAMIILPEGLSAGTKLSIEIPKTQKKADAQVARPPQMNTEGSLVAIEFTAPAPNFWNIFFPPATN
jgi:hypothetical protein